MNIILAHGILGFRIRFGVEYFREVAEYARTKDFHVIAPEVDPTAGIELRAAQLREQIEAAFETGVLERKVTSHIIAHSMGGLDSRRLLSLAAHRPLSEPIRSLTTIGTPHRGSPIADALATGVTLSSLKGPAAKVLEELGANQIFLDDVLNKLGVSLDGLRDLTSSSTANFNASNPDNPDVSYFSVSGVGRSNPLARTAGLFRLTHAYIRVAADEENDGMVGLNSAKWGQFDEAAWQADHADEVGHDLDNLLEPTKFDYLNQYDKLFQRIVLLK